MHAIVFTIDWRSALSCLASSIHITWLVTSCVLIGSLAKLLLCFSIPSILCLTDAHALGLLQHVRNVVPLLLSCVVWKHSEKVEHHAIIKQLAGESPVSLFSTALEVCLSVCHGLLMYYLLPSKFCIN